MQDTQRFSVQIGDKELVIETGLLARQAAGSATVSIGDTMVFSAVTVANPREGIDFFPLQVEYREKYYAGGRFPGGYFKREARPSEKETLISRVTDRPIRPLFPEGYHNDVQINSMLVSTDAAMDPDVVAVNAASVVLHLSDAPFMGPIGCVRIGRINGEWIINPTHVQKAQSDVDLVYAGLRGKFLMMEGSAKEISEEDFLLAMKRAHEEVEKIIDLQIEMRRALGKPDKVIEDVAPDAEKMAFVREHGKALYDVMLIADKLTREAAVKAIKEELLAKISEKWEEIDEVAFVKFFDAFEIQCVRENFLDRGLRVDGRAPHDIRNLYAQLGVLPRAHGSAIFNRGETQALAVVTLGTKQDAQDLDGLAGGSTSKKFLLHYNFPPYSVGEVGRLGGTGRREIGHGALAERSLAEVIPEDYPYTVRIVSEVMGSNGSSSMASICGGSLALMDAGVPIKAPVAGVSVGLYTTADQSKRILVTDILGTEDHCGDMDFKVGGTRKGITGFQVDLKLRGLTWDLVEEALTAAKNGRNHILDFMETIIPAPREELSPYAPRIFTLLIPVDKIGELIGPGGKNIRRICELSGAQIDIQDDGTVSIFANNGDSLALAKREVEGIAAEAEEGRIYEGTVSGIQPFGAFVEILPGKDGLCHISELSDRRVNAVEDVCKVGDKIMVKCLAVDDRGRIKLSRREAMRELDQQNG